jgi:hypothetical protein
MGVLARVAFPLIAVSLIAAGCMPDRMGGGLSQPAVASYPPEPPPGQQAIWARKDGQRMSTNPALKAQGEADQAACTSEASGSGSLNWQAFSGCMYSRGYYRRDVTG